MQKDSITSRSINKAFLHYCANKGKKITYKEMSSELGVSERTFSEWLRGTNQPMVLKAFLKLLSQLDAQQIESVIQEYKDYEEKN